MSGARDDRINQALEGLIESLLPQNDSEEDAIADERYFRALESAQDSLESEPYPSIAQDEGHVADLIRRKCDTLAVQECAAADLWQSSRRTIAQIAP